MAEEEEGEESARVPSEGISPSPMRAVRRRRGAQSLLLAFRNCLLWESDIRVSLDQHLVTIRVAEIKHWFASIVGLQDLRNLFNYFSLRHAKSYNRNR